MSQPPGIAQNLTSMWPRIKADQNSFTGMPRLRDPVSGHVVLELRLRLFGCPSQSHFTQRGQIALTEEVTKCGSNTFGWINKAVLHALTQSYWRNINQLNLIRLI